MHQICYTIGACIIFLLAGLLTFTMAGGKIIPPHQVQAKSIPPIPQQMALNDMRLDVHAPLPVDQIAHQFGRGK